MNSRRSSNGPVRILDEEEVAELRLLHSQGWTGKNLAEHYGVSRRTVWRYLHTNYPPTETARMLSIIHRWARLYALKLSTQEVHALAAMLVLSRREKAA